jgi:hypothetical protein
VCCFALENADNRIIGRRTVALAVIVCVVGVGGPGTQLDVMRLSGIERLRAYDTNTDVGSTGVVSCWFLAVCFFERQPCLVCGGRVGGKIRRPNERTESESRTTVGRTVSEYWAGVFDRTAATVVLQRWQSLSMEL